MSPTPFLYLLCMTYNRCNRRTCATLLRHPVRITSLALVTTMVEPSLLHLQRCAKVVFLQISRPSYGTDTLSVPLLFHFRCHCLAVAVGPLLLRCHSCATAITVVPPSTLSRLHHHHSRAVANNIALSPSLSRRRRFVLDISPRLLHH